MKNLRASRLRMARAARLLAIATLMHSTVHASYTFIPTPCEIEWEKLQFISPTPAEAVSQQKILAERGDAEAQYFMGVASQSEDDRLMWLKKAIANGSKGAAAYYIYKFDVRLTPGFNASTGTSDRSTTLDPQKFAELIVPVMEAADAGDPQAATWLMNRALNHFNGRDFRPEPMLDQANVPRWAAIAARGGNPAAAELLCTAHDRTLRGLDGLVKDDAQAFYWCSIAAPRTCSISAKVALSKLYQNGYGTAVSTDLADYWKRQADKSWKRIQIERPR